MMAESKAIVKTIKATSRIAIKIRDNYFTIEYSEEREIPNAEDIDMATERDLLFQTVNEVVDGQALEIKETFSK